ASVGRAGERRCGVEGELDGEGGMVRAEVSGVPLRHRLDQAGVVGQDEVDHRALGGAAGDKDVAGGGDGRVADVQRGVGDPLCQLVGAGGHGGGVGGGAWGAHGALPGGVGEVEAPNDQGGGGGGGRR